MAEDKNKNIEEIEEITEENEKASADKKKSGSKKTSVYSKNSENSRINANIVRIIISSAILTAIAVVLRIFPVPIPGIPEMFAVDFSVFPEFLASIAYGPLVGIAICLLKSVIHMIIYNSSAVPDIANFLINVSFVATAGLFYINSVAKASKAQDKEISYAKRGRLVFKSSLFALIPSLIIQFFVTNYYSLPTLSKQYPMFYSQEYILRNYIDSLSIVRAHLPEFLRGLIPEISEIWQGIIFINFPITFFKTIIITAVIALLYPLMSPYLHFRKEQK